MRRFLLLFLFAATALAGIAQPPATPKTTLALSQSFMVVKITDPARQIDTFKPVLEYLGGLKAGVGGQAGALAIIDNFRAGVNKMKEIPGVNSTGDFWIVVMPPAKPAAVNTPDTKAKSGAGKPDDKKDDTPAAKEKWPSYMIIPLIEPASFITFLQVPAAPAGFVSGKYGVIILDSAKATSKPKLPYTDLIFDVTLATKREIALSFQVAGTDFSAAIDNQKNGMPVLDPLLGYFKEMQQDLQRVEFGLAMTGRDLSIEHFTIPVPGHALAKQLASAKMTTLGEDYAAYLPQNLAYCGAGGPMLDGAPGLTNMVFRMGFGLLAIFLPDEQQQPFIDSTSALLAECSKGRALGITVPPANTTEPSTLVAVYHVTGMNHAKTSVRTFVKEFLQARDALMGGALTDILNVELQAEAEKVEGTPIDLINVSVTPPGMPVAGVEKDAPKENGVAKEGVNNAQPQKPIAFEGRVAYLDDKMLFTLGAGSKAEMNALIKRILLRQVAFTASDRFKTLKASLPEKTQGFACYATLDLCRALVNTLVPEGQRGDAQRFIGIFPPQSTVISMYQEFDNGQLHGELRIPDEQMRFLFSLMKAAQQFTRPATAPKK
ncbi:MAG: hypothetical protein ACYDBB_03530 [Armatimonadota bacterium]